jgi:hypothetical protein
MEMGILAAELGFFWLFNEGPFDSYSTVTE